MKILPILQIVQHNYVDFYSNWDLKTLNSRLRVYLLGNYGKIRSLEFRPFWPAESESKSIPISYSMNRHLNGGSI